MAFYLVTQALKEEIEAQRSLAASVSAAQRAEFREYAQSRNIAAVPSAKRGQNPGGRAYSKSGDVATITVEGLLTPEPDFWAWLFDEPNTTYAEIAAAAEEAEGDDEVKSVTLDVDSGGGAVSGLFEVLDTLSAMTKPVKASVKCACSAAYAIASTAGSIEMRGKAAMVGSIGVVRTMRTSENLHEITSTNAPNKRQDPRTEEGIAAIREEIDPIEELFVSAIAEGRGTTPEVIYATYGRGSVRLSAAAIEHGMADSLANDTSNVLKSSSESASKGDDEITPEKKTMTLEELKANYASVYAAAAQEGADKERERVEAHLEMGQTSGAVEYAVTAIKSGDTLTQKHLASYMSAAMNKNDTSARLEDNDAAAGAEGAAASATPDANEARDAEASKNILNAAAAHLHVNLGE